MNFPPFKFLYVSTLIPYRIEYSTKYIYILKALIYK